MGAGRVPSSSVKALMFVRVFAAQFTPHFFTASLAVFTWDWMAFLSRDRREVMSDAVDAVLFAGEIGVSCSAPPMVEVPGFTPISLAATSGGETPSFRGLPSTGNTGDTTSSCGSASGPEDTALGWPPSKCALSILP